VIRALAQQRTACIIWDPFNYGLDASKPAAQAYYVLLVGVGFFNRVHGQLGGAPNGVELAPVLKIEWLSSS
jgi:hypothetical protein